MKVLILAYDFPPLISIGGQRPFSWYKYLPQQNLSVTVITRHWNDQISSPAHYIKPTSGRVDYETPQPGQTIIRVPFKPNLRDKLLLHFGMQKLAVLRKILSYLYAFLEHLLFAFDSKSAIYFEAAKEIEKARPDVIIATGEPFILFKYASYLSAQYNIAWVADYRDSWTGNQGNYNLGFLQNTINKFYRRREQQYINNALFITTAAPTYARSLQSTHPDKKIEVVYNGFDETYFTELDKIEPPADKFIITYGGTIYPHQNLEMFLDGLLQFIQSHSVSTNDLAVNFYGIDLQNDAGNRLLNFSPFLMGYIHAKPRMPYAGLIKKMHASHLLLLLSRKGADWLNAKVFDYLAVKRPIFLVENDGSILESVLRETNGGVALNSSKEIADFLAAEYSNFKAGIIPESAVNELALKYSRKNQAEVLKQLLNSYLSKP